jgi:hypothetical protein
MFLGWLGGKVWKKIDPLAYDDLMFSTAGGLIAGQGISAILQCILKITNVEGNLVTGSCPEGLQANCP